MNKNASPVLSRRKLLVSATAGVLAAAGSRTVRAALAPADPSADAVIEAASAGPLTFDIVWSGDAIGAHAVRFDDNGDAVRVHTAIDVVVKVLWIKVFSYRHRSTEIWREGRLASFECETENNGRTDTVKGAARDDGFQVTGRRGTLMAPADIIPATFWNPEIVSRSVVLNPKKGTLEAQVIHGRDRVRIDIGGRPRTVTRYRLDTILNGAIDYDDRGQWAGAWFKKKGGRVHYRLRG